MRVTEAQIVVLNLPAVGLPDRGDSETVDRHTKTPKDDRNQSYRDYMRSLSEDQKTLNAMSISTCVHKDLLSIQEFDLPCIV